MPTKDDFNDHRLPRFLTREPEPLSHGKAEERAALSSHILKASIWAAAATALSIAILSVVGNPVTLLANVTASIADVRASLAHKPALQPDTYQAMPTTIQTSASVQALPTAAKEVLAREENATSSEPTGQNPTENGEGLFRQFQAWAAEKEEQAQVGPVPSVQVVQNAPALVAQNVPAQIAEDTRASLKPKQKHQHVRAPRNAQAEMRPVHNPRMRVRREQKSRVQDPAPQGARAPEQGQFVQNAQPPLFLQTFGSRN
ncbi:hypothetical protein [Bradyrhizobium sp. McL0615]|uniref:hypothetical protein n=1 Tax=Bradyrhizobium sp. McL0615 TaxID=3415673 RepID=UPI003CEB361C